MKFEELPDDLRETIASLKQGSFTIECDVKDALENAGNLEDFKVRASAALSNLINEARDAIKSLSADQISHRKLTEQERDRMIDICASGPLSYIRGIDDELFKLGLIVWWDDCVMDAVEHNSNVPFYGPSGRILQEWYDFSEAKGAGVH